MVRLPQYQGEAGRTVVAMTGSRAGELLRKPEQPPRATFLELFFDLVFVFAFIRVSEQLLANVTSQRQTFLTAVGEPLLLLLALLMIWFATTWVTDLYDPRRQDVGLVLAGTMFGTLLMAVALPKAFGDRALPFAGAYVAIHVGRGLFFVPALRGHVAQRRAAGVLLWFAVSGVSWIVGAILPDRSTRGALWALALAIEYAGAILFYPAPWTGRTRPRWPVAAEYISERYRQFFIVALGELIIVAGTTYAGRYFAGGGSTAAFLVSFVTTVLLFRIYTYPSGEMLPSALAAAPESDRLVRQALVAHLLMVVGIVAIAAGNGLVIEHPLGRTDLGWVNVLVGGPVLFIIGRGYFEHAVFARVFRERLAGLLVLVALAPVMLFVPPLAVATTVMAVLVGVAVADAARSRRRPSDPPSS